MGQASDRLPPAEEKLSLRLALARKIGKEFDEAKERNALGLPAVVGRDALFIPAKKLASVAGRDIDEGVVDAVAAELDTRGAAASLIDLEATGLAKDQRIAELERQLAEVTGNTAKGSPPGVSDPSATGDPYPTGTPNMEWSIDDLEAYCTHYGIEGVSYRGPGRTKEAVLTDVLTQAAVEGIL